MTVPLPRLRQRRLRFRARLVRSVAACSALALGLVVLTTPTVATAAATQTGTKHLTSNSEFLAGTRQGIAVRNEAISFALTPLGTTSVKDPYGSGASKKYDFARWTSPWVGTDMDARSLIMSWNAKTTGNTFIRFHVRTKSGSRTSSWDTLATWSISDAPMHRHSGTAQPDDLNTLLTDTLISNGSSRINQWQVQITLFRAAGTTATPSVSQLSAAAATYSKRNPTTTSRTSMTEAVELQVPRYSQMTHRGHFPRWGGGGEAWCSPTSTSMVLGYWKAGPSPRAYAWAKESDGHVDNAARFSYDYAYRGTGNWAFNTAYAAYYNMPGFVTRLWSLPDVEKFIKAGIPVTVSVAFKKGELTGAPISSTNGHLMVVLGFSSTGKVIVNDPAAPSNSTVRRVYDRGQFEKAWLKGSGGVAYVIAPASKQLPASAGRW